MLSCRSPWDQKTQLRGSRAPRAVHLSLSPVLDASVKAYCVAQPMSGTAFGVAVPEAAALSAKKNGEDLPFGVSTKNFGT